ncbi:aryl-sulfate sulfotransferase [Robertkochia flava]|uniref:aryl-sulfate sulfotransferase n=1 Tax=Robertkochia flava TaxID=3447986 RepID=UPI001CCEDB26|nr:aryl-sulfate sulfotransferase [Robertkochia marina]
MKRTSSYVYALFMLLLFVACSKDEATPDADAGTPPTENPGDDTGGDNGGTGTDETYGVLVNAKSKRQDGYVLVNDPGNNRVYIMDKDNGTAAVEWELPFHLGNDAKLLENGSLLVSMRAPSPAFNFGGFGGKIALIDANKSQVWNIDLASEELIAHHDVVPLPNGNVLTMLWEKTGSDLAATLGYTGQQQAVYTESLVEIDPGSGEVVWKWDSRDHLVQDTDPELPYYGAVAEAPGKIDINYRDEVVTTNLDNGDLMHANAVVYDAANDLIYMSVNYFSEVWVIDHSTTSQEAAAALGGNMGKGGDLVYRFGNPEAYDNPQGDRLFFNNHSPRFVPGTDHMLVFVNGNQNGGPSVVYELDLPNDLALQPGTDNEPAVVWEFSHPDMYSPKVSGAQRLPNGNTLIAIGTYGYWEVTPDKEVVWQFREQGFFWRGYHIDVNDPALDLLGVN